MAYNYDDGCLDWGDTIEQDSQEFIILPEGDYVFEVAEFKRGNFPGGAKIPPCLKAELTLRIKGENGVARIKTDLILHRSLEWKLCSFFSSIGQKKRGERLAMNWDRVVGSRGRCHVVVREYSDRNGVNRETNDVDRYYDYDPEQTPQTQTPKVSALPGMDDLPF